MHRWIYWDYIPNDDELHDDRASSRIVPLVLVAVFPDYTDHSRKRADGATM